MYVTSYNTCQSCCSFNQRPKLSKIHSKWWVDITIVKSYLILLSNINKSRQNRFHFDLISDLLAFQLCDSRFQKIPLTTFTMFRSPGESSCKVQWMFFLYCWSFSHIHTWCSSCNTWVKFKMVLKKVDNRIRVLIENGVQKKQRSLFVVVGDKGKDQVSCAIFTRLLWLVVLVWFCMHS